MQGLLSHSRSVAEFFFENCDEDGGGLAAEKLGEVVNQHSLNFIQRIYTETI